MRTRETGGGASQDIHAGNAPEETTKKEKYGKQGGTADTVNGFN